MQLFIITVENCDIYIFVCIIKGIYCLLNIKTPKHIYSNHIHLCIFEDNIS